MSLRTRRFMDRRRFSRADYRRKAVGQSRSIAITDIRGITTGLQPVSSDHLWRQLSFLMLPDTAAHRHPFDSLGWSRRAMCNDIRPSPWL